MPVALALAVLAFALMPRVQATPGLLWAVVGAGVFLLGWTALLWARFARSGQCFRIDLVKPVRSHYIQATVQCVVYAYWGWYWRDVYAQVPLIVAQLVFLYAFDALLTWSRGRAWRLGFGPLPIILSSNVFIWFKDDWFAFQFLLVATGALGKEFIRWTRDGRRTHVFNPSAFTLGLFSLVLILTGTSDLTWAANIAATISDPPHIYVVIFLLGLVVQYCFSITLMTFAAAATLCLLTLLFYWVTGTYFFLFSNVPAPVFLGLHLLVTDPSTSPRTSGGRIVFGALYGLGAFLFFGALHNLDGPTIYDKLLPVPLLNLSVRAIDRWASRGWLGAFNKWEARFQANRMNLAYMGGWSVLFLTLLGTGYVESPHEGNTLAFWRRAVKEGKPMAAGGLIEVLKQHARAGSDSAWNELGTIYLEGTIVDQDLEVAAKDFARASKLGNVTAAANLAGMILTGKGTRPDADVQRAFDQLEQECSRGGHTKSFFLVGRAYETGQGRPLERGRALEYYRQGCARGNQASCEGVSRLESWTATAAPIAR